MQLPPFSEDPLEATTWSGVVREGVTQSKKGSDSAAPPTWCPGAFASLILPGSPLTLLPSTQTSHHWPSRPHTNSNLRRVKCAF